MKTLFVRIAPQAGPEKFFSCGIEFSRAWKAVNDLDNATVARLKIEQMLETSETQPAGYTPAEPPVTGGDTSAVNGGKVLAGVGGVRRRDTPLRVAFFGDSTANMGTATSPDNQDLSIISAPFPASGATVIGFATIEKSMLHMVYPQAHIVGNCGISGETTAQMLARDSAAASSTRKATADLHDTKPDVIIYRGGSINDLGAVATGTWQSIADVTYARHVTILHRLMAAGVPVIDTGIFGYGDGSAAIGADPDSVRLALKSINARVKSYIASLNLAHVVFLDPVGILQADDGRFIPGTNGDGVHINVAGQYALATKEAEILTGLFGTPKGQRYPGTNLIANAMFASTGATGYGVLATGLGFDPSNMTVTNGQVQVIDGKHFQTFDCTITGAGAQFNIRMPCPVTTAGVVANDVYGFEFDYFVEGVDGTVLTPTLFYGRVDITKTGQGRVVANNFAGNFGNIPSGGYRGKQAFSPLRITESSAALSAVSLMHMIMGFSNTSGKLRVGVAQPRMVKLA